MEETMKEIHTLFCGGYTIKESQVFVSTLQHLLKRTKTKEEHDAATTTTTRCWATPQRWLLTLDTPSLRAALWNPSTQTKIKLPSMETGLPENCKCLLSREPDSRRAGGCVVLVVDDDEPVIWFCRVGGKRWTRHEYEITVEDPHGSPLILLRKQSDEEDDDERAPHIISPEEGPIEYILEGYCNWREIRPSDTSAGGGRRSRRFRIRSIAAVEGKFYFDVSSTKLGVLEFAPAGPTFTTVETERVRVAWDSWELAFPHLVESRGRLYLFVITQNNLSSVALYRMDFSRLAWCSVDRLYDQVFFLGRLRFTAAYAAWDWELGLRQGDVYYLGPYGLLNVFFAGDKRQPYSNLCHGSDLPAPLLGIHDVLTGASGFTIGSAGQ